MSASTARRVPSDGADRSSSPKRRALVTAIVLGVIALDQLTKAWAVERLSDGPIEIFGSDVGLRLSRNSGGAFSLFQGYTPLLAVLAIVLALILVRAVSRTDDRLVLVALALVLGGALGNLVDRLVRSPGFLRGEVVDFVNVGSFPTFNVADAAITVGGGLLLLAVVRAPDDGREAR
jgi:signal peptidase II